MKEYPSISGILVPDDALGRDCIAFEKLDGSNLRFFFSRRTGWCKFGTRRRLFGRDDPEYGQAIDLFLTKYADDVERVIKTDKRFAGAREVICYCEYFGPHSFGGQHDPKHPALLGVPDNAPMDLVLFDVNVFKQGLVAPRAFLDTFGHLHVPAVVYHGVLDFAFIKDVRQGKYPVREGVICKGCEGKAPHGIWYRKIKTIAYLDELKKRFAADWELYAE